MSSPIPLYSVTDLKNTTDDAIAPILTSPHLLSSRRFHQDHSKTNARLILGYVAVAVAAITFWADRKWDFNTTYPFVAGAVCIYFYLNFVLWASSWFVMQGLVFEGENGEGEQVSLYSSAKKHSPVYSLRIKCVSKDGGVVQDETVEGKYTEWFSSEGVLYQLPFARWLEENICLLREEVHEGEEEHEGKKEM